MGKGKKKNGKPSFLKKPAIIISAIVGVIAFVIAGLCIKRYLKLDDTETGIIAAAIGSVIGFIFDLIKNLIFPSETIPSTISQKIKGDKNPTIVTGNRSIVSATYTEASPELLDRLERANIEKGKQGQIIEELKKKLKETEEALKERHVPEDALARFKAGEYTEAEALFEKELKEGAEKAAKASYYLGNIKFARLRFDDARKYYQKATELEPKNPLYLNGVGFAYHTLGKYEEAIKYYEQALSIWKEVYGEKHPDVATALNNLGGAWHSLWKYEKAIGFYEKALSIDREIYGERHPDVARDLNNMGSAWHSLWKYEKAIEFYKQALSIDKEFYGERHPNVAIRLNNLGEAWRALGKYEKAIEFYEQALSIVREFYGKKHPYVAATLNNLGLTWLSLREHEKAIEFYEQALSIKREAYGERHPSVATSLNNLGGAWKALGKYEKARECLTMSYKMFVETLGENHPNTRQVKTNLDSLPE